MPSKSTSYTPKYTDEDIAKMGDAPNISGLSPAANVTIEEHEQRKVATNPKWMIARTTGFPNRGQDSKEALEGLGFTGIQKADDLFYEVQAPDGWTKTTQGYWTTINDETGKKRLSQFYKGAWYDRDAFVSITESK